MRILTPVLALLAGLLLSSNAAATTEAPRRETTATVGSNTITADNILKFTDYTVGRTLTITLDFSSTCNIVFSGLTLRSPGPFWPPRLVKGVIGNITAGTPTPGHPGTTGSVTFDIRFDSLMWRGVKQLGAANLNLVLGVDGDCNPHTGDGEGVDESTTIGVQIQVVTANQVDPGRSKPAGYSTLGIDPKTHLPIYEGDRSDGPQPGTNYYLAGISGNAGQPVPSTGSGLPIWAPIGADPAAVAAAIKLTGGTAK